MTQMFDPVWARDEIDSPCIKLCVIHPKLGICAGCYRSLQEIADWSAMAPDLRRAIMEDLPERAGLLKKRRGGREARLNDL
jgi:predicted Fe-S protein YdhL (DUF1289 family)